MNILMVQLALLQIVLPTVVIVVNALIPLGSPVSFGLRTAAVFLLLFYTFIAGIWLFPPWWTPYALALLHLLLSVWSYGRFHGRPAAKKAWKFAELAASVAALCGMLALALPAVQGRVSPDPAIDLAMPLEAGHYLVVSGGASPAINAHYFTLNRDSAAAFRGQSYAVDIIGINRLGIRSDGISPSDPADYVIYERKVLAPCAGVVLAITDGIPDNRVPVMNREQMTGNSVILNCDGLAVVLAHFIPDTITVAPGDAVETGQHIAQVGNSGNSGEPHLHVHVQSIAPPQTPIGGDPRWFTINGVFLTRNARIEVAG